MTAARWGIGLLFALLGCAGSLGGEVGGRIEVSVAEKSSMFGRKVPFAVRYQNGSKVAPWIVSDPLNSSAVAVQYRRAGTNDQPGGYWPAHLRESGGPPGVFVGFIGKPMEIAPGKAFEFDATLEPGWSGRIVPSRWAVWVIDENLGLESNVVEVDLFFTLDSATICRQAAGDRERSVHERRWHAKYLQRILPDLDVTRWRRGSEEFDKETLGQMEVEIQQELDRFDAFWKDKANAAAIKEAIDKINRDAGLEVEGDPAPGNAKPDGSAK